MAVPSSCPLNCESGRGGMGVGLGGEGTTGLKFDMKYTEASASLYTSLL